MTTSTSSSSSSSSSSSPPPVFSKLSPDIWLHTPPSYRTGHLVILCTWIGALDKHIAKYTAFYARNFPTAKILLIKASMVTFITSYPAQRKAMRPAVSAINAHLSECRHDAAAESPWQTPPDILLHVISSGGANSTTQLLLELHSDLKRPLSLSGILFDSAPAGGSYWKGHDALTQALPKTFPFNVFGSIAVHTLLLILHFNIALGRYGQPEDLWRDTLLDESLHSARRACYVYSKADRLTSWQGVKKHIERAKEAGWDVREVIYEDTRHVNHMPKDEAAYLAAIKGVWERAMM